jgi:protein-L-isoaspartate(D-aspartate) O-methyltransferase
MNWTAHDIREASGSNGSAHSELANRRRRMIHQQLVQRGIADERVLGAMDRVPRERFVGPDSMGEAYEDRALAIECGQTISQPYIVAMMTQALRLSGTERVLEVGTGSGYQTAILAELASEVVTIERHAELSRRAAQLLRESGYRNLRFIVGDGWQGWPEQAPYDRIIVTAAADRVPPRLMEQLIEGGILAIPVGGYEGQELLSIAKRGGQPVTSVLSLCRFVPLVEDAS